MQNLLLAAGLGSRSEGKKLLFSYQGETLVHRSVRQSLLAGLYTVVVTGFKADAVQEAIKDLFCDNLLVVHNLEYAQGQGSSTRCGACHLRETESFFISLSDMPLIEERHYRFLMQHCTAQAARPSYKGRLGHPVLLSSTFLEVIKSQNDPFTMRTLLAAYPVQEIEVDDEAYILDIDTLQDYQTLLSREQPPQSLAK